MIDCTVGMPYDYSSLSFEAFAEIANTTQQVQSCASDFSISASYQQNGPQVANLAHQMDGQQTITDFQMGGDEFWDKYAQAEITLNDQEGFQCSGLGAELFGACCSGLENAISRVKECIAPPPAANLPTEPEAPQVRYTLPQPGMAGSGGMAA